jgi:hypothetical protein
MVFVVMSIYIVSALLPLVGLLRLAVKARAELSTQKAVDVAVTSSPLNFAVTQPDGSVSMTDARHLVGAAVAAQRAPRATWKQIRLDLYLIGGGLVLNAVASVWSLFL